MHDLSAFQRDILWVAAANPRSSGQAIARGLREYGYTGEIYSGRLYPNLDRLVEKGLLEKGKQDERTNWYNCTTRAERALHDRLGWLADCAAGNQAVRPDWLTDHLQEKYE